jgi:hypothetical protein
MSVSNDRLPLLRAPLQDGDYKGKKFSGFQSFLPQLTMVSLHGRQKVRLICCAM